MKYRQKDAGLKQLWPINNWKQEVGSKYMNTH